MRAFCPYLLTAIPAGCSSWLWLSRHEFQLSKAEQLAVQHLG